MKRKWRVYSKTKSLKSKKKSQQKIVKKASWPKLSRYSHHHFLIPNQKRRWRRRRRNAEGEWRVGDRGASFPIGKSNILQVKSRRRKTLFHHLSHPLQRNTPFSPSHFFHGLQTFINQRSNLLSFFGGKITISCAHRQPCFLSSSAHDMDVNPHLEVSGDLL